MANALPFLSEHIIEELRKLEGRTKVSYPYADASIRRTERIKKLPLGTTAAPKWKLAFGTADPEYSEAKLVEQTKLGDDGINAEVYQRYEELTGLPLVERELYKGTGVYKQTVRQRVPAGTLPTGSGGGTLSHTVSNQNALYADSVKVSLVDSDGNELSTGLIVTTEEKDRESDVTIFTDLFLAAYDYTLPVIDVGGDPRLTAAQVADWKQPNTSLIGYSGSSYSPKRYPISARKIDVQGSKMVWIEVQYHRKPSPRVSFPSRAYQAPAIFEVGEFPLTSNQVVDGFRHKPPWPIGAQNEYGYDYREHRTNSYPVQQVETWHLGRDEALPPEFGVISPGAASKVYNGLIGQNTIHAPIKWWETPTDGTVAILVEDIPSSTPASYDPAGIYVIQAQCEHVRGPFWKSTVVNWSEETNPKDFPTPETAGFYLAQRNFTITPSVELDAKLGGKKLYAQTIADDGSTGSETVRVKVWGKKESGDGPLSSAEIVTAAPTVSTASVVSEGFLNARVATLEAPLVSDSVLIYTENLSDHAALRVTGAPSNGDVLAIGLNSNTLRYLCRTTLTEDSLSEITLGAGGSGYLVTPTVTVGAPGVGGKQAYAEATISGGAVTGFLVTWPGRGYDPDSVPSITIGDGGTGATATAVLTSHSVTSFSVSAGGNRYSSAPGVTLTVSGSAATVTANLTADAVTSVTVNTAGTEYGVAPIVTITGDGTGATAHATIDGSGHVSAIVVDTGGSGYTNATATLSYGRGQGAQGTASVSGGAVTGIAVKTANFATTDVNTSTNIFTISGHGLSSGDGVTFTSTGTLPATASGGLTAGTVYYALVLTSSTFKLCVSLAAVVGTTALDITTQGTGTHTMTYCGQGYFSAPTVSFTGGTGSGASGTAVIDSRRQIKISSVAKTWAQRIVQAINANTGVGTVIGTGTTAHPDLAAQRDASDLQTVLFASTDPITAPGASGWTFAAYTGEPFVDQASAPWAELTAFESGETGQLLCTIPAGEAGAFFSGTTSFSLNRCLDDAATDNDVKAVPSVPGLVVAYTNWLPIPTGKDITLIYNAIGPALKVSYQLTNDPDTPPAPNTPTLTVTNGSKTFAVFSGSVTSGEVGRKIVIAGDTQENELTSATTLLRAYTGAGTAVHKVAEIENLTATALPTAGQGHRREVILTNPGASYIRLKIQQPVASTSDHLKGIRCPAMWAAARWTVGPDD